ncbi:hypothetical protein [Sediminicola luteus]|uniref:Uncharacterized protein n=1 Tax=Sediminicola luteus TaxID=319238 RepID=A0ABV2TY39_9FLAO
MAKHIHVSEYNKQSETLQLACECGWKGATKEAFGEIHEAVMDFECPKCDKMLLIVNLIVDAEKFYGNKNKK